MLGKDLWDVAELVVGHAHQRAAEGLRYAVAVEHQVQALTQVPPFLCPMLDTLSFLDPRMLT